MAGIGLLALLDDIATILDDVALLTKVASKKTAGLLGDDLALNAEQVSGVRAERELPVVWAVAKGSFKNKLILVPAALTASALVPWLITPVLMLGGAYLCYEGFEKVAHIFTSNKLEDQAQQAEHIETIKAIRDNEVDIVAFENEKVKGAIRTDFILSAEIIVIALGTVLDVPILTQVVVVSIIALIMTIGVYGVVAGIVKLDDAGFYLIRATSKNLWGGFKRALGRLILRIAPYMMKTLSVVGTVAMFLVGGGILVHGIPMASDIVYQLTAAIKSTPAGNILGPITPMLLNGVAGFIAGAIVFAGISLLSPLFKPFKKGGKTE